METLSKLSASLGVATADVISYAESQGVKGLAATSEVSEALEAQITGWVADGHIPKAPDADLQTRHLKTTFAVLESDLNTSLGGTGVRVGRGGERGAPAKRARPPSVEFPAGEGPDISGIIASLGEDKKQVFGNVTIRASQGTFNANETLLTFRVPDMEYNLAFIKAENGRITEMGGCYGAETLAVKFDGVPKDMPGLKEIRQHLGLPDVTAEARKRETERAEAARQKAERLAGVQPGRWLLNRDTGKLEPASPPNNQVPDVSGASEVMQGQFGIVQVGKSNATMIQTFGAGPCVILTLYDPETRTGLVAHFDAMKKPQVSLNIMLGRLRMAGVDPANLEARIIGGQTGSSEELIYGIDAALAKSSIQVVEKDILGMGVRAAMLDAETGDVDRYVETIHETPPEVLGIAGMQTLMSEVMMFDNNERGLRPN